MTARDLWIEANTGKPCWVSGAGDLAVLGDLRPVIHTVEPGELVRLTKGGMAVVRYQGKEYSVPPRNVVFERPRTIFDEVGEGEPRT